MLMGNLQCIYNSLKFSFLTSLSPARQRTRTDVCMWEKKSTLLGQNCFKKINTHCRLYSIKQSAEVKKSHAIYSRSNYTFSHTVNNAWNYAHCFFLLFIVSIGTFHSRNFRRPKCKIRKKKNIGVHKINIFDLFRLIYLKKHSVCMLSGGFRVIAVMQGNLLAKGMRRKTLFSLQYSASQWTPAHQLRWHSFTFFFYISLNHTMIFLFHFIFVLFY